MPYIKFGQQNEGPIELHYQDHGKGQPIVLIHGWPLSERSWENQESLLLDQGYRVIKYDRRGFGESSKPIDGYNYDTLAGDLNEIMNHLDLQNTILAGFSMGAGEVARYLGKFGCGRVAKAIFISGITPFLLNTEDNPEGVERKIFTGIEDGIRKDRAAFLEKFFADFYSHNKMSSLTGLTDVSEAVVKFSWQLAIAASPIATIKCVSAWLEDFREDLAKIHIPTLVIHGDSDRIVPVGSAGKRMLRYLQDARYIEIASGPHGVLASHPEEVNKAILEFLGAPQLALSRPKITRDQSLHH